MTAQALILSDPDAGEEFRRWSLAAAIVCAAHFGLMAGYLLLPAAEPEGAALVAGRDRRARAAAGRAGIAGRSRAGPGHAGGAADAEAAGAGRARGRRADAEDRGAGRR